MPRKCLDVNLDDIVQALDDHTGGIDWYLDTATGQVCPLLEEYVARAEEHGDDGPEPAAGADREELELAQQILRNDDERYVYIPPGSTAEAYQVMKDFIPRVRDERLRERLADAIAGKGAFRAFKDELLSSPKVREQWFEFEASIKRRWARDWLASVGIETEELTDTDAGWDAGADSAG